MIQDLANIANDKRSDWLRCKKDSQLDIFNYQSRHCWQRSNTLFRCNDDFDDDHATFASKLIIDSLFIIHTLKKALETM